MSRRKTIQRKISLRLKSKRLKSYLSNRDYIAIVPREVIEEFSDMVIKDINKYREQLNESK